TESGQGVSAETARRLLCDSGVVPLLEAQGGQTLEVGRKKRTVPAALRRAVAARDQGCQFPSCCNRLVDLHHLVHWVHGGDESMHNITAICRRHHVCSTR